MRRSGANGVSRLGRAAAGVAVLAVGLGLMPSTAGAQADERRVTATAECSVGDGDQDASVRVTVQNEAGVSLRVIAVDGFSTGQVFVPFYAGGSKVEVLDAVIADGESAVVEGRWTGVSGGDGEGYAGGATVVTNLGVLNPICSPRPQDAGALTLSDPLPRTAQELRLQEARSMGETLGRLESWRAYPLLFALLHPDAQEAVGFDRLQCWYADTYGMGTDPLETMIFGTTVSVAEVEPWEWPVSGETYEVAVAYDYEQEIGTLADQETVSGTAHLAQVDGAWRWFFGSSEEAIDALPRTCGVA